MDEPLLPPDLLLSKSLFQPQSPRAFSPNGDGEVCVRLRRRRLPWRETLRSEIMMFGGRTRQMLWQVTDPKGGRGWQLVLESTRRRETRMLVMDATGSTLGTTATAGRLFEFWPEVRIADATGRRLGSVEGGVPPRARSQAAPWAASAAPCRFLGPSGHAVGEVSRWVFPTAAVGRRGRAALRLEFADEVEGWVRLLFLAAVIGRETAGAPQIRY